MKESVNNKIAFNLFIWLNFFLTTIIIMYFFLFLIESMTDKRLTIHNLKGYNVFLSLTFISWLIIRLIDLLIKPAYFEARISYSQISLWSYNQNRRNGFRFILLLFYQRHLKEQVIERQSYNNYRIMLENFGFKKSLVLQKTENGRIYESNPINISLLGVRKYTDLILSIDRLKEKFSVN